MFWHKKEEAEHLPDLPPVKPVPDVNLASSEEYEEDDEQRHGLPSFPDSALHRGFSQAAIKDAVSQSDVGQEQTIGNPMNQRKFRTVEMEDSFSSNRSNFPISPPPFYRNQPMEDSKQKDKDVYIRIDKFYSARKALETTRDKLNEIDELLRKIRETKLREEQELNAWEKELSEVKARVHEVVETIFEKVS